MDDTEALQPVETPSELPVIEALAVEVIEAPPVEVVKRGGRGGFYPGHPRYGGRKKGSVSTRTKLARETASRMKFDSVEFTIKVIMTGELPNADGTKALVTPEERLKLLRDIQQYLQPKLSAVQVTGKDDGPLQVATLDITQILSDPNMAETAQRMALMIAEQSAVDVSTDDADDESDD